MNKPSKTPKKDREKAAQIEAALRKCNPDILDRINRRSSAIENNEQMDNPFDTNRDKPNVDDTADDIKNSEFSLSSRMASPSPDQYSSKSLGKKPMLMEASQEKEWKTVVYGTKRHVLFVQALDIPEKIMGKKVGWIYDLLEDVSYLLGAPEKFWQIKELMATDGVNNQMTGQKKVLVRDIPLGILDREMGAVMKEFTVVEYNNQEEATKTVNQWSTMVRKNAVRIYPMIETQKTIEQRKAWKAKLVDLLQNCTAHYLSTTLDQIKVQSCFIPRTSKNYTRMGCAYIEFNSEASCNNATKKHLVGHLVSKCPTLHKKKKGDTKKVTNNIRLAKLYVKRNVSEKNVKAFGGRSYAKMAVLRLPHNWDNTNLNEKQSKKRVNQSWKAEINELRQQVNEMAKLLSVVAAKLGVTMEKKKKRLNNPGKAKKMLHWIIEEQFDFVIVTETKITPTKKKSVFFGSDEYYAFWELSAEKQIGTGVGILVKKCWIHHVKTIKKYYGRLLHLGLKFRGRINVHIVGLYMSASKLPTEKAVAKEIRKLLGDIVQNKEIIIVADNLNEDLSSKSLEETYATNKVKACSTVATLQHMNLVDTHGVYAINNPEKTWALNGVQRRLDYVFTDTVTALLVTNIAIIYVNESFSTDYKAKTVLQAADCLPKRKVGARSAHTKKKCMDHKLVKIVADIIKQIRVNNANIHDNNVMQLLAKWKQLKPEMVNAYLMILSKDKLITELFNIKKEYRSTLHARIKLQQQRQIVDNIIKRQQNFDLNKRAIIKSILNKKRQRIVLDHVIEEGKFHDDPDEIKKLVNKKAQGWTRTRILEPNLWKSWEHRFEPIKYIPDHVFDGVMTKISNKEFEHILSHTPITKLLAHQPKEWGDNIDITRPITLIESTRKILKILTARISKACELHNVLKSYNTSVLKNTSTAVPIHVINTVAEHAKKFGNEAWFTFQDIKKAYDSVGWKPIEAALKRIKMNNKFTELFGLMHNNKSNKIITEFGLSNKYQVQDRLDQRKTSSPIMWRIFYDSLLCEVKQFNYSYRYKLTAAWKKWDNQSDTQSLLVLVNHLAFVDDTVWIANLRQGMQSILDTASSFFRMVDIEINLDKTETMVVRLFKGKSLTSSHWARKWTSKISATVKKKAKLLVNFLASAMYYSFLYNLFKIDDIQAKSKITNLLVRLNSADIAGMATKIRLANLQAQRWSTHSILEYLTNERFRLGVNLIVNIIQIIEKRGISFRSDGNTHVVPKSSRSQAYLIETVIPSGTTYTKVKSFLRKKNILYLYQIQNKDKTLMTWMDYTRIYRQNNGGSVMVETHSFY
ncbi:hypothetical protein G9A89_021365 [Geosiphon pyriformis]|nr:hypothetical protein G9A89_021365 [Geosiphon pyriformis]